MYAWVHSCSAETERDGDHPERLAHTAAVERGAGAREKERTRAWPTDQVVALSRIAAESFGNRRVQRHQPRAVELRFSDRDDACTEVDVLALQHDRLAHPHAGGGEEPEQCLVGRRPDWRAQRSGPRE